MDHPRIYSIVRQAVAFFAAAGLALAAADQPQWKAVPVEPLVVQPGSALDCSSFISAGPAGRNGRVIVGPDGHLAFEHTPERRVKFERPAAP